MADALLILLGALLAIISQPIADKIKSIYWRKQFLTALCAEFHDLRFRIAMSSLVPGLISASLDKQYCSWLKQKLKSYSGNKEMRATSKMMDSLLLIGDEAKFQEEVDKVRGIIAGEGNRLNMITLSSSFLESNLTSISELPIELQTKIHEFRNLLMVLNREIDLTMKFYYMTYDSSISEEHLAIIDSNLETSYKKIHKFLIGAADKLDLILSASNQTGHFMDSLKIKRIK